MNSTKRITSLRIKEIRKHGLNLATRNIILDDCDSNNKNACFQILSFSG